MDCCSEKKNKTLWPLTLAVIVIAMGILAAISAEATVDSVTVAAGSNPLVQRQDQTDPEPIPSPAPIPLEPTFDSINEHVFSRRCVGCHSEGGRAEHIPLTSKEEILESPRELVIPGNPDESGIVLMIERQDGKRMPPPPRQALSADEMQVIREWIANGAVD